jgi:hypothetical protein
MFITDLLYVYLYPRRDSADSGSAPRRGHLLSLSIFIKLFVYIYLCALQGLFPQERAEKRAEKEWVEEWADKRVEERVRRRRSGPIRSWLRRKGKVTSNNKY